MSIQFLRFPSLVQREILKNMFLEEQFTLALLSKRSQAIIKKHATSDRIRVSTTDVFELSIINIRENFTEFHVSVHKNPRSVELDKAYDLSIFAMTMRYPPFRVQVGHFPGTKVEIFYSMVAVLSDIFHNPEIELCLRSQFSEDNLQPFFNDKDLKLVMEPGFNELQPALDLFRTPKKLLIRSEPPERFRYRNLSNHPFASDHIEVDYCSFIEMSDVIKMFLDCKTVILKNGKYSDHELNSLIQAWLKNSRTEFFEIGTTDTPIEKLLDQIPSSPIQNVRILGPMIMKSIKDQMKEVKFTWKVENARKIQREDGNEVVVCSGNGRLVMGKNFCNY